MNKKFITEISSDLDYEEMVAYVSYENHTVALITMEKGLEFMEIEFFSPPSEMNTWKFLLDDFLKALQFAKDKLRQMQKLPEE